MDISLGLQSAKAILDGLKAMQSIRDDSIRAQAAIDLQRHVLELQGLLMQAHDEQLALTEEKRALEAEVVRLEDWSSEKENYELKEHGDNRVIAYARKAGMEPPEPEYSLCPNCFADGKKSIAQPCKLAPNMDNVLVCHRCGWEAYLDGFWQPSHGATRPASWRKT